MQKSTIILCLVGLLAILFLLFSLQQKPSPQSPNPVKQEITPDRTSSFTPAPLSLEHIFAKDHSWTATLSAERKRVIVATGDVIPARAVNYETIKRNDFTWPFQKTADVVKDADITFINLETPLLHACPVTQQGMIFCGDAKHVEGLLLAGVDIASLANNHAGNYQEKGVEETVQLLQDTGIAVVGTATINPTVIDIRGMKFAFLGYDDITTPQPGVANVDEETIKKDIANAKTQADYVIVTYHWGVEYRDQPDDRQIYLGHFTIDAGADLVIGNHPHWIQPVEMYKPSLPSPDGERKNKLITYAHGNYIFDQMWSEETKKGVICRYTFYDNQLVDVEYLPLYIENYGQPHFLEDEQKQKVLEDMKNASYKLQSP